MAQLVRGRRNNSRRCGMLGNEADLTALSCTPGTLDRIGWNQHLDFIASAKALHTAVH